MDSIDAVGMRFLTFGRRIGFIAGAFRLMLLYEDA
jgi:hypothetical protein